LNLFRAAVVDPSAQQGGTCTNLPVSYYKNARDIKVYLNNTDVNIIQQGEGDGVNGSTPPCDAYLLMYAFMCVGLLFGLSLLLYVLASIYTERLVRVRISKRLCFYVSHPVSHTSLSSRPFSPAVAAGCAGGTAGPCARPRGTCLGSICDHTTAL